MSASQSQTAAAGPVVEAYMLGQVDYDAALALQQRLVYEQSGRNDGQIALVVCEHPRLITVGRHGSRAHIRADASRLAAARLEVRWVNRGGGCLLHDAGQLAVYPIVPLTWHRLSVGDYLIRLQRGIRGALAELGLATQLRPGRFDIWGRAGKLVSLGVAVKGWTTYFGAYLNVAPPSEPLRDLLDDADGSPPSWLAKERQEPIRMPRLREALVRSLADAFGCRRYHYYTSHPLWQAVVPTSPLAARAG